MGASAANDRGDRRIGELLHHWFDGDPAECDDPDSLMRKWFAGTPAQDRELARRFGSLFESAAAGELDAWVACPRGRLALIIVLDQLSRSLHRGTPAAFAQDDKALALCLAGLDAADDKKLHALERIFFLMPLQHAESSETQDRAVEAFEALAASDTDSSISATLRICANHAIEHRALVRRFGRFPHRNAVLGRESTELELEFLAAGASHYGQ